MRTSSIRKSVVVPLAPEAAFRLFTAGIGSWWPLASHSVSGDRARTCTFETHLGGKIFEVGPDGNEALWGTVLVYEPFRRLVFSWHPGRKEETAQEVEVRFETDREATAVFLEHRDWENLVDQAEVMYERYDTGWDFVLGSRYSEAARKGSNKKSAEEVEKR
jgi:uncharacterized protein YndB with AHSA1/START domain